MDVVDLLMQRSSLADEQYLELLRSQDPSLRNKLFAAAQEAVNYLFHRRVYMQGVLEFTNHCPRNCFYCDLREENRDKKRFRLNSEEIRGALKEGYELGLRSFILESGEDHYYTDIIMGNLISTLKGEFPDCALGLSIGERSRLSYSRMKKSGADRYLLRFETADPLHFSRLHPPSNSLSTKIDCLNDLKLLGYELDTGFLVGLLMRWRSILPVTLPCSRKSIPIQSAYLLLFQGKERVSVISCRVTWKPSCASRPSCA